MPLPTISVILVNYNGYRHLDACLRSLRQQDYPADRFEVVLVDNGSSDESLPFIRERYPEVRLIENAGNSGFSPAVNQGVRAATGQYVALLNNDTYAAPGWLSGMIELMERRRSEGVVCVAARILDWHGKLVDFDSAGISFYGYGIQLRYRLPAERVRVAERPLLFACGGAMLVDRQIFLDIGGFDEQYFAYFEDVDFGWRLWVAGHGIWLAPEALVYHRHHGTSAGSRPHQHFTILQRNALATIIKNYDQENLDRVLPAALLLLNKKGLLAGGSSIDRSAFDLSMGRGDGGDEVTVPLPTLSYMVAAGDLLDDMPGLMARRAAVQALRRRPDSEILPLFNHPFARIFYGIDYAVLQEQLVRAFGIDTMFEQTRAVRVLVLCGDPLRSELAGTGIRSLEIARVLSRHCQVMLVAPEENSIDDPLIDTCVLNYGEHDLLKELTKESDVIVAQGLALSHYPALRFCDNVLVLDVYTPFVLENLAQSANAPRSSADLHYNLSLAAINNQLDAGDYFICASERQRDFWLGALMSQGRVNPDTHRDDPSLRAFIDVVPFGISSTPPCHTRQVLKGVHPGIGVDDTLLIWNGGIWEWFDPLTILRALDAIRHQRPDLRLFFMGAGHPNKSGVPHMPIADRTLALAQELGLLDTMVFFNNGWVPYSERGTYLLESDIGVSAHYDTAETRLSFRTRLLDCIWAGLPMIVSSGDSLSELVADLNLGRVVAAGDVAGWAAALLELAAMPDRRASFAPAFAIAQERLSWERTLEPLVRLCRNPRHAADSLQQRARFHAAAQQGATPEQQAQHNYIEELEQQVAQKNEHITRLEGLVNGLEQGRVMRLLRRARGR